VTTVEVKAKIKTIDHQDFARLSSDNRQGRLKDTIESGNTYEPQRRGKGSYQRWGKEGSEISRIWAVSLKAMTGKSKQGRGSSRPKGAIKGRFDESRGTT